jgi:AraC-like DNA-binding protein
MYDHVRLFARVSAALACDPGASLERLARNLRIHPHTVAQVIREQTGTSFSAWRARRRIADACMLLRTRPDLSIKEVAAAAGFSSTSVFDRFLRRTCGRSPSECRLVPRSSPPRGAGGHEVTAACERPVGSNVNRLDDPSTNDGAQREGDDGTFESSTASS